MYPCSIVSNLTDHSSPFESEFESWIFQPCWIFPQNIKYCRIPLKKCSCTCARSVAAYWQKIEDEASIWQVKQSWSWGRLWLVQVHANCSFKIYHRYHTCMASVQTQENSRLMECRIIWHVALHIVWHLPLQRQFGCWVRSEIGYPVSNCDEFTTWSWL